MILSQQSIKFFGLSSKRLIQIAVYGLQFPILLQLLHRFLHVFVPFVECHLSIRSLSFSLILASSRFSCEMKSSYNAILVSKGKSGWRLPSNTASRLSQKYCNKDSGYALRFKSDSDEEATESSGRKSHNDSSPVPEKLLSKWPGLLGRSVGPT